MHRSALASRLALRAGTARGFTILELAVTLAILGMLAVGVLVPLVAQVNQRRINDTERILEQAKEALLGFAAATGRLPCPALPNSDGFEKFTAVAPAGTTANGRCATYYGFLPAATLGFTPVDGQGYGIDGWGTEQNRIRYAVSNISITPVGGAAVDNPFTRVNGMRDATPAQIAATDLFFVCPGGANVVPAPPACAPGQSPLTVNAPVVIWSSGANAASGGRSADEAQNPHANPSTGAFAPYGTADRIFVSRIIAGGNAEFDDIVTWLSVGGLVSRMVLAGQLP